MSRKIIFVFGLLLSVSYGAAAQTQLLKDRSKEAIISYLNAVIRSKKIITGQHCDNGAETAKGYTQFVEGLKQSTGKYPALIGIDYGFTPNNDLHVINQTAIEHWNKGGFITICWHADNPFEDGYNVHWNSVTNKDKISLAALLRSAPDSPAKTSYRAELLKVGKALKELQDKGIVVLWRPLHEMNGSWFWWGVNSFSNPTNTNDYKLLWQDMYATFTQDLGLTNLIWIYSPNTAVPYVLPVDICYPGDKYVDVVGLDIYAPAPSLNEADYLSLKKYNKPFVIGEIGPNKLGYGKFDESQIGKVYRGKAAYFLQWSGWKDAPVSLKENTNARQFMNDRSSISL